MCARRTRATACARGIPQALAARYLRAPFLAAAVAHAVVRGGDDVRHAARDVGVPHVEALVAAEDAHVEVPEQELARGDPGRPLAPLLRRQHRCRARQQHRARFPAASYFGYALWGVHQISGAPSVPPRGHKSDADGRRRVALRLVHAHERLERTHAASVVHWAQDGVEIPRMSIAECMREENVHLRLPPAAEQPRPTGRLLRPDRRRGAHRTGRRAAVRGAVRTAGDRPATERRDQGRRHLPTRGARAAGAEDDEPADEQEDEDHEEHEDDAEEDPEEEDGTEEEEEDADEQWEDIAPAFTPSAALPTSRGPRSRARRYADGGRECSGRAAAGAKK